MSHCWKGLPLRALNVQWQALSLAGPDPVLCTPWLAPPFLSPSLHRAPISHAQRHGTFGLIPQNNRLHYCEECGVADEAVVRATAEATAAPSAGGPVQNVLEKHKIFNYYKIIKKVRHLLLNYKHYYK